MVGNAKQGYAILAAMAVLWTGALVSAIAVENAHPGIALQAAGAATEGKEVRFGIPLSAMFAVSTTMTSTGAIDSTHSSYTGLGGGVLLLNMLLGEIAPGGSGSGLYGMLVLALVAVFIAGLMVGRTPTYLGKRIGPQQRRPQPHRDRLRVRLRREQQRLRLRGPQRQYRLLQHRAGDRDVPRPVRADRAGPRAGGIAGPPKFPAR
jgi:hypothetical protein